MWSNLESAEGTWRPPAKNWKLHRAKWSFLCQKSNFSKSVHIDPKVPPMSQKRLAVCDNAILSFIRGLNASETTPWQNIHFDFFKVGSKVNFSTNYQIDPKVSPMSLKRFAVCKTAILSSIRGHNAPETRPCRKLHFEVFRRCWVKRDWVKKCSDRCHSVTYESETFSLCRKHS